MVNGDEESIWMPVLLEHFRSGSKKTELFLKKSLKYCLIILEALALS